MTGGVSGDISNFGGIQINSEADNFWAARLAQSKTKKEPAVLIQQQPMMNHQQQQQPMMNQQQQQPMINQQLSTMIQQQPMNQQQQQSMMNQQQQPMMNQQQQPMMNQQQSSVNQHESFSSSSTPDKNARYGNKYDDDYGAPESKDYDAPYISQREFEWNIAFTRLAFLNDLNRTLDLLLLNEPMFEAAELYASSSTNDHDEKFNGIINLLRAQLLYKQNPQNYEPIVLALEDMFGITTTGDVSNYIGLLNISSL